MLTIAADITALEAAAKAATPGPWKLGINIGRESFGVLTDKEKICESNTDKAAENTAFIAAANPSTVLELCEAIRDLLNEISAPCHGCITDNSRRNKDSNFCGLCSRGKLLTEYGYPIPEREATP